MTKTFILDRGDSALQIGAELQSSFGHEIMVDTNPRAALTDIVVWQPDVVVAEALEVDGLWLCKELKATDLTNKIPVILLCKKAAGIKTSRLRAQFMERNSAEQLLVKPLDIKNLWVEINRLVVISQWDQRRA